jgi:carbonic anhydrase
MRSLPALCALVSLAALAAVQAETSRPLIAAAPDPPLPADDQAGEREAAVHWAFDGATGPAYWGQLSPEFRLCGAGLAQSPVDLSTAAAKGAGPALEFGYRPSPLRIVNDGHTIRVNYEPGSWLAVGGERFELVQFHFHAPSEHALAGGTMPLELHLVHARGSELAVVGVMLVPGAANEALDPVWRHLPPVPGPERTVPGVVVDAAGLVPALRTTFRYSGSLTTPPCDEGVRWFVMAAPIPISLDQLAAYQAIYPQNRRPLQPLNGRAVVRVP